jgi:type 1 glutamine amidotransferase
MKKLMTHKIIVVLLAAFTGFNPSIMASKAEPNEVKRLLVCSVTQSFRHSSIAIGEQTLKELAAAHDGFEIAVWIRQPDIEVPRGPRPPRQPGPDANETQIARYEAARQAFEKANKEWEASGNKELAQQRQLQMNEAQQVALQQLSPDALRAARIDAVVFNNTSGNLALPDLDGLIDWVEEGHGFISIHAGTDTLKNESRYTEMTQGIFNGHGPQVSATLHAGDPDHPANAGIGAVWHLPQEEIYLFKEHDRSKVRNIWYMRHHPNDPEQEGYFPIVWCRYVGEGRFFNTALGHREDLFCIDPQYPNRINPPEVAEQFRAHLLGGILWTLRLAEGSGEPNP